MELTPFIIACVLILVGILGIIIPILPDMILIFAGILVYAIWTEFSDVNIGFVILVGGLAILGMLFDYIGSAIGAKKAKASGWGIFGAILGAAIGVFIGGIFGMIALSLGLTILFEVIFSKKELSLAFKAGLGSIFGIIFAIIFKFVLAITIVGLFLIKVF